MIEDEIEITLINDPSKEPKKMKIGGGFTIKYLKTELKAEGNLNSKIKLQYAKSEKKVEDSTLISELKERTLVVVATSYTTSPEEITFPLK